MTALTAPSGSGDIAGLDFTSTWNSRKWIIMSITNKPSLTPQQYEILHGGGAEAAEIAHERLSRRRFLRRSMLTVWGLSATAAVGGALFMLYPNLAGQFGSPITVGPKPSFPAPR